MSSRATTLHVSRVNCRRPLPSAPSTSASGCRNGDCAEIFAAFAVEADGQEAAVVQLGQRAREILHQHQRHKLQRAGGGFRQHAGGLRAVARRGDDRLHREGRRRSHDRADIVRIGDLVEHQHDAFLRQRLDIGRGQGIGLGQQALMHGVGAEPLVDRTRPDDLGRDAGVDVFVGKPLRGVLGQQQFADLPRGLASAAVTVCQP